MAMIVKCPNRGCGQSYSVGETNLGRRVKCKKCGETFTVKMSAEETSGQTPPPSPANTGPPPLPEKSDLVQPAAAEPEAAPVADTPAAEHNQPGKIGSYVVRRRLGGGAMGEVWLAHDPDLERDVAIKTLRAEHGRDPEYLKRFLREARAVAKLQHANTVTIYQVGAEDNMAYLVMELMDGGSLEKTPTPQQPTDWREATRAVRDAAAGLAAAHEAGLVHRDIKPANLMRTSKGVTKVVDFGLARARVVDTRLTQQGTLMGTPAYMAPEQWLGQEVDARCDLYALVCTYYQLLTGQLPFDAPDLAALGYQHRYEPFPDPRHLVPNLPDAVCRILARGSQKAPEQRYQSAAELVNDLDAVLAAPEESLLFQAPWLDLGGQVAAVASGQTMPQPAADVFTVIADQARAQRTAAAAPRARRQRKSLIPPRFRGPRGLAIAAAGAAAVLLLAVVIYMKTDYGTVRITLAGDGGTIQAKLDGDSIEIIGLKEPLRLKAGKHNLEIAYGDSKTKSKSFVVHRGQEAVVEVSFEPTASKPDAADIAVAKPPQGKPPSPSPANWMTIQPREELLGWTAYGSGKWSVEAGGVLKGEGVCGWLGTDQEYDDFEFRLEFRLGKDGQSGIFLRAWPDGPPDGKDFLEIQLVDDTSPKYANLSPTLRTAAVYKTAAPTPPVQGTPHVWHAMAIRGEGPNITVQYEGQTVVEVDLDKANTGIPGHRRRSGRIGLQTFLGTTVEFRNIAIRRLVKAQSAAGSPKPPLAIAPFDAATAKQHQAAWAKHLGVPVEVTNSIGMKLVLLPRGEFLMGSPDADLEAQPDEKPQHRVEISQPFYLGACEVAQNEYQQIMGTSPSSFNVPGGVLPVESISWQDAQEFCKKLSALSAEQAADRRFRLPTEAEWEYACRAGTTFPYGLDEPTQSLDDYAWYSRTSTGATHPVGKKRPNAWGLHDMRGNVWEWCADWYGSYSAGTAVDPSGPAIAQVQTRIYRGGGWLGNAELCRVARRFRVEPGHRTNDLGFRVAFSVPATAKAAHESASPKAARSPNPQRAIAPFDAATAKKHQAAWAKHLGVPVEVTNSIGMELVLVPAGEFDMGASPTEMQELLRQSKDKKYEQWHIDLVPGQGPQHRVRISKPFCLGRHEVTQGGVCR